MSELWALAAFSFVSAVTPGPNNVMLWASGVQFGFQRTIPHVIGITLGVGSMALLVATGLGVLITTIPAVEIGLKVIGSLYLLYLALQIAGDGGGGQGDVAQPLTLWQAMVFQYVNPKAWVFVLAAVTTFRPPDLQVVVGTLLMALVMMVIVVPCAFLWAAAGTFLNRFLAEGRRSRVFRIALGGLLAATVVYIWI
ncbi:MAG TPA: LysE family translocator [Acidimicrobiia bacterium]